MSGKPLKPYDQKTYEPKGLPSGGPSKSLDVQHNCAVYQGRSMGEVFIFILNPGNVKKYQILGHKIHKAPDSMSFYINLGQTIKRYFVNCPCPEAEIVISLPECYKVLDFLFVEEYLIALITMSGIVMLKTAEEIIAPAISYKFQSSFSNFSFHLSLNKKWCVVSFLTGYNSGFKTILNEYNGNYELSKSKEFPDEYPSTFAQLGPNLHILITATKVPGKSTWHLLTRALGESPEAQQYSSRLCDTGSNTYFRWLHFSKEVNTIICLTNKGQVHLVELGTMIKFGQTVIHFSEPNAVAPTRDGNGLVAVFSSDPNVQECVLNKSQIVECAKKVNLQCGQNIEAALHSTTPLPSGLGFGGLISCAPLANQPVATHQIKSGMLPFGSGVPTDPFENPFSPLQLTTKEEIVGLINDGQLTSAILKYKKLSVEERKIYSNYFLSHIKDKSLLIQFYLQYGSTNVLRADETMILYLLVKESSPRFLDDVAALVSNRKIVDSFMIAELLVKEHFDVALMHFIRTSPCYAIPSLFPNHHATRKSPLPKRIQKRLNNGSDFDVLKTFNDNEIGPNEEILNKHTGKAYTAQHFKPLDLNIDLYRNVVHDMLSLNHPNVAKPRFIIGDALVYHSIPDKTLVDVLREKQLFIHHQLKIVAQIVIALKTAHLFGIYHGNLIPQNIRFHHHLKLKIINFGFATMKYPDQIPNEISDLKQFHFLLRFIFDPNNRNPDITKVPERLRVLLELMNKNIPVNMMSFYGTLISMKEIASEVHKIEENEINKFSPKQLDKYIKINQKICDQFRISCDSLAAPI